MSPITVYGTEWCEDTQHTRQHLDQNGVPYNYVDLDPDPRACAWVREQNAGRQITPTIRLEGLVLSEPSDGELDTALRAKGLLA